MPSSLSPNGPNTLNLSFKSDDNCLTSVTSGSDVSGGIVHLNLSRATRLFYYYYYYYYYYFIIVIIVIIIIIIIIIIILLLLLFLFYYYYYFIIII